MSERAEAWAQCTRDWLQQLKNHSGSEDTFYNYNSIVTRFVASLAGKPLDHVVRSDILAFMALPSTSRRGNVGQPVRASTRNSKLSAIQSLYTFASSYEVMGDDGSLVYLWQKPLPTIGLRHEKKDVRPRQMSESELERFFAVIPDTKRGRRDRCLFYCYLILGRRRSELLRLTFGAIQPALIDGRPSHTYSYVGKGDSRQVRQKELPADVYCMICDLLKEEGRLATIQPGDYIFANLSGCGRKGRKGQPLAGDMIGHYFHLYAKEAGLPPHLSLHSLRWSSAFHRMMNGESLMDVRDALDHTNVAITQHYLSGMISTHDSGADKLTRQFAFLR